MIGYLRGKLILADETYIILDVAGVGYRVRPTSFLLEELPSLGEEIAIFIYTHVRDDAVELYGFKDREQLGLFRLLLRVSGIGPSIAMALVSTLQVADIKAAINNSDIKTLCLVNGVGKKTAQRLVLELKGELPPEDEVFTGTGNSLREDLFAALEALGYPRQEVFDVVKNVMRDSLSKDLSELLRKTLQIMAKE